MTEQQSQIFEALTKLIAENKKKLIVELRKGARPEVKSFAKNYGSIIKLVLVEREEDDSYDDWATAIEKAKALLKEVEATLAYEMQHPVFYNRVQALLDNMCTSEEGCGGRNYRN